MTWADMVKHVATAEGRPPAEVQRVLRRFVDQVADEVAKGERVAIPGLGVLSTVWRREAALRSVHDGRRVYLDGRFQVSFRAANRLREQVRARSPQLLRDPEHQRALRVGETLVSDLALYHKTQAPALATEMEPVAVRAACAQAFGPSWLRVEATYVEKVPEPVRTSRDYLALAARRRWAS